jgi:hypothetical protein
MERERKYDPRTLRHHKHLPALCRLGSRQQLVRDGVCSPSDWAVSMRATAGAKARNRYWATLGYPNLVRARAAQREAQRRRKLMGLRARDHSLDDMLEAFTPLLPPRALCAPQDDAGASRAQPMPPQVMRPARGL